MIGEISLSMFVTAYQLNDRSIDQLAKIMAVCLVVGSIVFLLTSIILIMNHISKNHFERISTIRILFNEKRYNELEKYFDNIGASVKNLRSELQIGNNLISAILKDESDKHTDVSVDIVGKIPPVLRLDNMDICTIFYNLFDNAFTAAECSEKKSVGISVRLLGKNLFFTIKNTISHKIEIVDNILITEKDDTRRHGFGSGNAANCAERNGGKLIYECSDTHFVAELILPNIDSF